MKTNNRLNKLRRGLADKNLDAVLVSQPENRYYLSGFNGSAGYLVITGDKAFLATDFRYTEQAGRQAPEYEVFKTTGRLTEWFPRLVGDLNIKKLGFEAGDVTFSLHRQLADALKKEPLPTELIPLNDFIEALRTVKEPEEIKLIRKAIAMGDDVCEAVTADIRPGITEQQIAWELERRLRESGSQPLPFEIIVAAGPNAALPHAKPSERAVKAREPVVIDMGARYEAYTGDLTRTVCAGQPDAKFKEIYSIVLEAQLAAIAGIREDMTGQEADGLARDVITKAGYGEAFGHGLGHGIGLATHEAPRLGPSSTDVLTSGMVFTIEPGIYLPGWGGVRIEDSVMLANGKIAVLSGARKASYQ